MSNKEDSEHFRQIRREQLSLEETDDDKIGEDFEPCGSCGYDHSYEYEEAVKWHKENDTEFLHSDDDMELRELSFGNWPEDEPWYCHPCKDQGCTECEDSRIED